MKNDDLWRVLDTLTEVARERVVLVITHEREHLDLFDQVLFLEDGRVRGAGRHAELMERDDAYRRMAGRTAEAAP